MAVSWDDMRIFIAVAREGSLSGAGNALKLDPATVGRRVQRLEESLGAPLFLKSPQGYAPSEAGERLMPHAEELEQAMLSAEDAVRGQEDRLTGTIRVGAPDGCANFLLPQVVAGICDAHPGLEVQIVSLPRVFNLNRREADMAIAVSRPTAGRLTVQKITDYHLYLAANRRWLKRNPITRLDDLQGKRLVGYVPDMIFDKELDYLGELGLERVHLASNSVSVQFAWVRRGAGIGVVHGFALGGEPKVERVLGEQIRLRRTFWLVRHADERRVRRLSRFADLLCEGLRAEVERLEAEA
ncbi:MAG: LysR family transcriptional regulator [Vannielia sp.]|uniref:LysR family transcriptional regulator n=1 Tax=Rhodobacterales TaxID=204455 RepID=UPI0020961D36|nr:LysR family transcriptional regulator [Oceanicola sp. 502str15]MCO6382394.1 LysR family transcriptional regulator [Oceanicola sp. 502str15]